jgi:hypothetical protein
MFATHSKARHHQPVHPKPTFRRRRQAIALAASLCAAGLPSLSQAQGFAALYIEATGFNDDTGHAIAKLCLPSASVQVLAIHVQKP